MGGLSIWHWIVVIAVIALLFGGRGKISSLMGDFASGIKAFKKGMSEDEVAKTDQPAGEPKPINHQTAQTSQSPQPGATSAPGSTTAGVQPRS